MAIDLMTEYTFVVNAKGPGSSGSFCRIPRCSIYGIFTYIWVFFGENVDNYSSTMEHMALTTTDWRHFWGGPPTLSQHLQGQRRTPSISARNSASR